MLAIAFCSLACGAPGRNNCSQRGLGLCLQSAGRMYENIQRFSFSNIDKFSTAGLVTRMTTDVTNVQNSYQMILRIAVRAPLYAAVQHGHAFATNARLSLVFVAAIIVLGCVLALIVKCTTKIFRRGVPQIRRVKRQRAGKCVRHPRGEGICPRGPREPEIYRRGRAALPNVREGRVHSGPSTSLMMLVIYGCVLSLSWFGAHLVVGGDMTTAS